MNLDKIAYMARLNINVDQMEKFEENFKSVVKMIDKDLSSLDADLQNVKPMNSPHEDISPMREDKVGETHVDKIFSNSDPKSKSLKCFSVPKVI